MNGVIETNCAVHAQVAQLKSDNAQLEKVMTNDHKDVQKTIDAQNKGLRRVEKAISRLTVNIAWERKLRDKAVESKTGAEVALLRNIGLISQEICVVQKKYLEKVEVIRSMLMDSTYP